MPSLVSNSRTHLLMSWKLNRCVLGCCWCRWQLMLMMLMQGKRVNDSLDTCFGSLIVSFGQLLDQVLKIYNFPLLWKPVMPQVHPRTITYSDQYQKTTNYLLRHFPSWIWRRTKMIRHKFQRVIVSFQVCFKVVTPEDILKAQFIPHLQKEIIKWKNLIWIYHQQTWI